MRQTALILMLVLLTVAARAMAPHAACFAGEDDSCMRPRAVRSFVAALDGNRLHLAKIIKSAAMDFAVLPADNITTLAAGHYRGKPVLLAARGKSLLRLDVVHHRWDVLGTLPAPIREIHPSPDGAPAAMLLTGGAGSPVPADGVLWWATWGGTFTVARVTPVKDYYRPWQFWWSRVGNERRFAVATYKKTHFAPFPHNCMFLFAWKGGKAEARWLGSRLSRPYVDAAHADLRGDGQCRMVAVEQTKEGGRALSVYHPIGFGYQGEWRTEAIPGLERVANYGNIVLCFGHDAGRKPCAWRLLPEKDGYRLVALTKAPPAPEVLTRVDQTHLAGRWNGAWQIVDSGKDD